MSFLNLRYMYNTSKTARARGAIHEAGMHRHVLTSLQRARRYCSIQPTPGNVNTGRLVTRLNMLSRVDKQECATPDLSCTICRYPAPTAEFFVYVTFFQRNADSAAEQCESTCWAPTLDMYLCKAQPSARGKTLQKARSACVVEKITSTKNSAVGQPIRELHTLVYLLLMLLVAS